MSEAAEVEMRQPITFCNDTAGWNVGSLNTVSEDYYSHRASKQSIWNAHIVVLIMLLICVFAAPTSAASGEVKKHWRASKTAVSGERIPDGWETYTIFLVCNPARLALTDENENLLKELFVSYFAFGQAIGANNAAFWLVRASTNPAGRTEPEAEHSALLRYDAETASFFCQNYHLRPSEGPHVIVSEGHPEDFPTEYIVVSLNQMPSNKIRSVLSQLADQILAKRLSQAGMDKAVFWARIATYFEKFIVPFNFIRPVRLKVSTKFATFELELNEVNK